MQAATDKKSQRNGSEMSFWDHLDVLRSLLMRGAIIVAVVTMALFTVMPELFDRVILAPCRTDFPTYRLFDHLARADLFGLLPETASGFKIELINTAIASQFMIHISTSFWLGLVLSAPALIVLVWNFISPALYLSERRPVSYALALGSVMFFVGAAVSYFLVFPLALRFLAGYQLSEAIPNWISIDSYMDTLTGLTFVMGLTFELPLAAWILGRVGLLKRDFFTKYRRHAIVALLVVAAIITPTGDPVTLFIVFAPLYLLWEFSALVIPRRSAKAVEAEE